MQMPVLAPPDYPNGAIEPISGSAAKHPKSTPDFSFYFRPSDVEFVNFDDPAKSQYRS